MQPDFSRINNSRVMADFVAPCKRKGRRKVPFVCLPEGGCFYRRFLPMRQNLMVSNNILNLLLQAL